MGTLIDNKYEHTHTHLNGPATHRWPRPPSRPLFNNARKTPLARFKGGEAIYRDESAGWNSMSGADRERWTSFAYEVKGWERDQEDD